jgi:hypothetical protein
MYAVWLFIAPSEVVAALGASSEVMPAPWVNMCSPGASCDGVLRFLPLPSGCGARGESIQKESK